jgi:hypothetical protein
LFSKPKVLVISLILPGLLSGGCGRGKPQYTPTPTKTPTPIQAATAALTPTAVSVQLALPAVVKTLPPLTQAAATPAPVDTLASETTPEAPAPTPAPQDAAPASTPVPVDTPPPPTETDTPVPEPGPILPPQRDGSWDMEDGFYVWPSPYENFGGFVANGWASFIRAYEPDADPPNAPRLNENKEPANVQSGAHSQEISFDYRSGEIGIYRVVTVTPGHRYLIEAWAKYAPSPSGVQLDLGVDLTGGEDFEAATVAWYPWRDLAPDRWIATQEAVQASGDRMTIFLRAIHAVPELGGNTMFDNVSTTDLGP